MIIKRRTFVHAVMTVTASMATPRIGSAGVATKMTLYKDPDCGCCHLWGEAMSEAGFDVDAVDVRDLAAIKGRFGISADLQGCHTAELDGYFLEGHVPLAAVRRLLAEKPDIAGLAVPGMPPGSLGMGDDPGASYDVLAVPRSLATRPWIYMAVRPKA